MPPKAACHDAPEPLTSPDELLRGRAGPDLAPPVDREAVASPFVRLAATAGFFRLLPIPCALGSPNTQDVAIKALLGSWRLQ